MKRYLTILLACALVISGAGCSSSVSCPADPGQSKDLMAGIEGEEILVCYDDERARCEYLDFSLRLLQQCYAAESTLLSPLSVYTALSMTAEGARGETGQQMRAVLGIPAEGWFWDLYSEELKLANAIWLSEDEGFTVNPDFLQTNADCYGAGIYSAPFDDATLRDINNWVAEHTDGRIPEMLDTINPDAVMYLVNALAFQADWQTVYAEHQLRDRAFTREDGTTCRAEFMYSEENSYLENDIATGFMKQYKGGSYAFVALLPGEGMTMAEFVNALDGQMLAQLLSSVEYTTVDAAIPSFEAGYGADLAEPLKEVGMPLAFDPEKADFSGMGTYDGGNISISMVLHKTYIRVDAEGTQASAATVVTPTYGAAPIQQERKSVILDRPFLYMIVDTEAGIPIFIGTMMNPGER